MKKPWWTLLLLLAPLEATQAGVVVRGTGADVEVEFQYRDPKAGMVAVAGSFNRWSPKAAPMEMNGEGVWTYVLRGVKRSDVLQYKFVVGTSQLWVLDPEAPDTLEDGRGGTNGQVVVPLYFAGTPGEDVPGDLLPEGLVSAQPAEVAATVVPPGADKRQLLDDPGFERGELSGWTVRGDTGAVWVEKAKPNARGGEHSLKYVWNKPFQVLVLKRFTGLAPGVYSFRAWSAGGGGETALRLVARGCSDTAQQMSVPMLNNGWQKWKAYTVKGIRVTRGECTVGIYVKAPAERWGNLDDFEFFEDTSWTRLHVEPAR